MSDAAASSVPPDIPEKKVRKRKSKRELLEQPITDVTVEDVELSVRDFINLLVFLLQPRKILKYALIFLFFILTGYAFKVWMWVDMCVLQSTGVPCSEEYSSLFSMKFPVSTSAIYRYFYPDEDEVKYSRSFFALDTVHLLCCVSGSTYLGMFYLCWRAVKYTLNFFLSLFCRRYTEFKRTLVSQRRRNLVQQTK